jgi:hypothetical protein
MMQALLKNAYSENILNFKSANSKPHIKRKAV